MKINALKEKLLDAYSTNNLHRLSLVLLNFYKNKQFSNLQTIAGIIEDTVSIQIDENGRGFSRFMMLYHPDRADFHRGEINRLAETGDYDRLLAYSHILMLERIEEIALTLNSSEDIDYSPVYSWDINAEGFRIVNDNTEDEYQVPEPEKRRKNYSFYEAVKIRMYGNTHTEFPHYYLEDWEEFELSGAGIEDLEGIQFCRHVRNLYLSENYIHDLTLLGTLTALTELNLSDNQIGYTDALSYLVNLQSLNLSNNFLRDIEPLLELPLLEYIDLTGNPVEPQQVEQLRSAGVTVDV
jgi:Leucine-rich repeat (LRR) protein